MSEELPETSEISKLCPECDEPLTYLTNIPMVDKYIDGWMCLAPTGHGGKDAVYDPEDNSNRLFE